MASNIMHVLFAYELVFYDILFLFTHFNALEDCPGLVLPQIAKQIRIRAENS